MMYEYDLSKPLTLRECVEQDRAALAHGPVARGVDGTLVFLRYADCIELLGHPHTSGGGAGIVERQGITEGPIHQWFRDFFATNEPPSHTRMRSVVSRPFHVRPIERMRGVARKAAEEALDDLKPGAPFNVVEDFAYRVPLGVLCAVLGMERRHFTALRTSLEDLGRALVALALSPAERANGARAIGELYAVIEEVAAEKRAQPSDDLISLLVQAEDDGRLSHGELLAMVSGLMFAGIDTTKTLITLQLYLFSQHPEQLEQLRRSPDPLAPLVVEEILRFAPPAPWVVRFAAEPIECAGQRIAKDELFLLSLSAANQDQEGVVDPARFDITRAPTQHLGLGRGRHFCLGAALARLEGQEMLRALASRDLRVERVGEDPRWLRADQLMRPLEPLRLRFEA
jgi:cytochrome P450